MKFLSDHSNKSCWEYFHVVLFINVVQGGSIFSSLWKISLSLTIPLIAVGRTFL